MQVSGTISTYLSRQFFVWFIIVFLGISGLLLAVDSVELMRRSANKPDATVAVALHMAFLHLPHLAQEFVPFAILFGGLLSFARLTRNHELVVVRAAGVSVWQFLLPAFAVALTIGVAKVAILNPVAAGMLSKYEQLEGRFLTGRSSLLAVTSTGLWLRQLNERSGDGQSVIHARSVLADRMELQNVIVFQFDEEDRFIGRIDARSARLLGGNWELRDALLSTPERTGRALESYLLATDLTPETIQESFASPSTVSFWQLPRFIQVLEETGFSGLPHRLRWHALIAEPVLALAMVLIAATFSLRPTRRGGTVLLGIAGVLTGFLLFVLSNLVQALGLGASLPAALAAWTPAGVSLLLGAAMLLHLEDG